MKLAHCTTAILSVGVLMFTGCAAEPTQRAGSLHGVAGRGQAYARIACSQCHAVEPQQGASPNSAAPTFESLANTPGMTNIALNAWLNSSHRDMPALMIEQARIRELSAYIDTLRSNGQP